VANSTIPAQLQSIVSESDFQDRSSELVEDWLSSGIGLDAIEPILSFMEANPAIDFGLPGPLVHFLERYYGNGYEAKLIESVLRKPTRHTAWMLNRVINKTKTPEARQRYIGVLERAQLNPLADPNARQQITHFLQRLAV
jgi:hypothetical protein